VGAVRAAYRWWKSGQLGHRGELPAALVDGLSVYDGALNATQVHDMRAEQEARDRPGRDPEREGPRAATQRLTVNRRKRP
jgi:hypothetical protein